VATEQELNILESINHKRISYPLIFVDYMGDHDGAIFLNQLWFWSSKGKRGDGFIYKSRLEWQSETRLSDYAIRKATETLKEKGTLETKLHRANGAPTLHYRLKTRLLLDQLKELANQQLENEDENPDLLKSTSDSLNPTKQRIVENDKSITYPNSVTHKQSSAPKIGADEDGIPEPEYVPLDEDGYPQDTNPTDSEPIIQYIVSESRRNITPTQAKKLMSGVPFHNPKYPAPSVLFQKDRLFEQFVSEKIKWATGAFDGKRKTTGSLVSAICKYETEKFGWLDYKQAHEERRELEAEMTYTKPETPPPYQGPEVDPEELKAFYKELGIGRNGKKLTDEEIEELVKKGI